MESDQVSFLDVLGRDLIEEVFRHVARRPTARPWIFYPEQVWFLVALNKRLRWLVAHMREPRLPLEVNAWNTTLHIFVDNYMMSRRFFDVVEIDVRISEVMYDVREQYEFARVLRACDHLTNLTLRLQLEPGMMHALRDVGNLTRLTSLSIFDPWLFREEKTAAFAGLSENLSNLTSLSLWRGCFGDGDMLALAFQQMRKLVRLEFYDVNLSATTLRNAFVPNLDFRSTLTHLHLSIPHYVKTTPRLDEDTAVTMTEEFLEALSNLTALRSLYISNLDTFGESNRFFTGLHALNALTSLTMWGCEVNPHSVPWLAAELPKCTALLELDLTNNHINVGGLSMLVIALRQCTHLRSLELSHNDFDVVPQRIEDSIAALQTRVNWVSRTGLTDSDSE